MNLNKLRDEIHDNAVKHGFWEGERSIAECLVLIHSEVSEALEADRNGKYAKGNIKPETIEWMAKTWEKITFLENFILKVKDTFEDELADVVIRCLDLCGHLEIELDPQFSETIEETVKNNDTWFEDMESVPDKLCVVHYRISKCFECRADCTYTLDTKLTDVVACVMELCVDLNIDLLKHVELKMKYNETREYKHGKKY